MRYLVWGSLGGLTIGAFLFTFGMNANWAGIITLVLVVGGAVGGFMMDQKNPS